MKPNTLKQYLSKLFGDIIKVVITRDESGEYAIVQFGPASRLIGCFLEAYLRHQQIWPCSQTHKSRLAMVPQLKKGGSVVRNQLPATFCVFKGTHIVGFATLMYWSSVQPFDPMPADLKKFGPENRGPWFGVFATTQHSSEAIEHMVHAVLSFAKKLGHRQVWSTGRVNSMIVHHQPSYYCGYLSTDVLHFQTEDERLKVFSLSTALPRKPRKRK